MPPILQVRFTERVKLTRRVSQLRKQLEAVRAAVLPPADAAVKAAELQATVDAAEANLQVRCLPSGMIHLVHNMHPLSAY